MPFPCALLASFALALGGTLARKVAISLAVVALTCSLTERVDAAPLFLVSSMPLGLPLCVLAPAPH